jgi:hypothetical protein
LREGSALPSFASAPASSSHLAGLPVDDEDVHRVVGIVRDEIEGVGVERDVAAVAAERGVEAVAVHLEAVGTDAHPARVAGLQVVHEDVRLEVRVRRDQVERKGRERDDLPIRADRRSRARAALRLVAVRCDVDPRRRPRGDVVDEDIAQPIRVAGHQIGRVGDEGDVTPVRADRG